MIKPLVLGLSLTLATAAMAERQTCTAAVTEKNLNGVAKNSFLRKCERDAKAACEAAAKDKTLYGVAKTNFEKKCVKDAVGEAKSAS